MLILKIINNRSGQFKSCLSYKKLLFYQKSFKKCSKIVYKFDGGVIYYRVDAHKGIRSFSSGAQHPAEKNKSRKTGK